MTQNNVSLYMGSPVESMTVKCISLMSVLKDDMPVDQWNMYILTLSKHNSTA